MVKFLVLARKVLRGVSTDDELFPSPPRALAFSPHVLASPPRALASPPRALAQCRKWMTKFLFLARKDLRGVLTDDELFPFWIPSLRSAVKLWPPP